MIPRSAHVRCGRFRFGLRCYFIRRSSRNSLGVFGTSLAGFRPLFHLGDSGLKQPQPCCQRSGGFYDSAVLRSALLRSALLRSALLRSGLLRSGLLRGGPVMSCQLRKTGFKLRDTLAELLDLLLLRYQIRRGLPGGRHPNQPLKPQDLDSCVKGNENGKDHDDIDENPAHCKRQRFHDSVHRLAPVTVGYILFSQGLSVRIVTAVGRNLQSFKWNHSGTAALSFIFFWKTSSHSIKNIQDGITVYLFIPQLRRSPFMCDCP